MSFRRRFAGMSFRRRLTLLSAAAVAVAVVLSSALIYALTSNQLHRQVDNQLRARLFRGRAVTLAATGDGRRVRGADEDRRRALLVGIGGRLATPPSALPNNPFSSLGPRPNEVRGYLQLIGRTGQVMFPNPAILPVDAHTRALAAHGGKPYLSSVHSGGVHLRVLAEQLPSGSTVQFAQPLTNVDNLLGNLRLILGLLGAGGIALAALLGRLVAGAAVAPVKRLERTAQHVAETRDLSQRIEPANDDEIGRLATSFNAMMDALQTSITALDASVSAQRQLVADASHELRTPVTSLRTNVEILQEANDLDEGERRRLLADVVEQIEELTLLINDVIELARGDEPQVHDEDVRFDLLVEEAVVRARLHAPGTRFELDLEPTVVRAMPARLDRAVNNLLDNAMKHGAPDQSVELQLRDGELRVCDHGPGIADHDLPHVFDRFYRGVDARGRPGSGLGLAIVRQVAASHGGSVSAGRAADGGTIMRLRLPASAPGTNGEIAAGEGVSTPRGVAGH